MTEANGTESCLWPSHRSFCGKLRLAVLEHTPRQTGIGIDDEILRNRVNQARRVCPGNRVEIFNEGFNQRPVGCDALSSIRTNLQLPRPPNTKFSGPAGADLNPQTNAEGRVHWSGKRTHAVIPSPQNRTCVFQRIRLKPSPTPLAGRAWLSSAIG